MLFTIVAISLVATFLLSMAMSSEAFGATLGAPTSITQCKPATTTTITLCWTAPTVGGNPAVMSYIFLNATETCTGSGGDYTCSFGNFVSAYASGASNYGLNATTGTGSAGTQANFTKLTAGDMFQFKIMAFNAHGNGTLSSAFQAGSLLGASVDYSARPTQSFANGTQFGASTEFAADQDFANFQNFGVGQVFGSGTAFAADQTFNGTQNFSDSSIKFDSGTQFDTVQTFGDGANFTGATSFTGANTFGDSAVFGKDADFSIGGDIQTFGDSGNFSGVAKFGAGNHVFGASTIFATDQPFLGAKDFSAASMGFGSGTTFDTLQTFGEGANFTGKSTFTGINIFGVNAVFGDASVFPANQAF